MFEKVIQEGPTNLSPSGPDGVVKVAGVHGRWLSNFTFSHPGYSNVYGESDTKSLSLAGNVRYLNPLNGLHDQFVLEGNWKKADQSNGFFIVEMQKRPSGTP
jgi:hypothetical protein